MRTGASEGWQQPRQPGRPSWWLLAVALVVGLQTAMPGTAALAAAPVPPGSIAAARHLVAQRAAAAGRAANRLAAAQARLGQLEARAEMLVERYDGAVVALRGATRSYRAAQARYTAAVQTQATRRRAVGQLASEAYQTDGAFGSMTQMMGGTGGPQGYFDRAGTLRLLGEHNADLFAGAAASSMVAEVFRGQAHVALQARQAAASRAAALKQAAQAAVAVQRTVLSTAKQTRGTLVRGLAAARARVNALEIAAARAAAERAAAARAAAARPAAAAAAARAGVASGAGAAAPAWAYPDGAPASAGDIAADWALRQLGKPYVWAAAGPYSFDCSGLTMRAWEQAGVQLDHWTGTQWKSGPHIPIGQLRRGDLVFFANNTADPATIHHVGIYIGHGMMVDAPYTGVNVRIDTIDEPGLIGATRPA